MKDVKDVEQIVNEESVLLAIQHLNNTNQPSGYNDILVLLVNEFSENEYLTSEKYSLLMYVNNSDELIRIISELLCSMKIIKKPIYQYFINPDYNNGNIKK